MSWTGIRTYSLVAAFSALLPAQIHKTLTRNAERSEILRTGRYEIPAPIWSGDRLIGLELNDTSTPIFWTIDRNGRKEEIQFSIPDAARITIWNLTASTGGTIVAGGTAVSNQSQGAGFLSIIPPDRGSKIIVRTRPYVPRALVVDPNNVIWSAGSDIQSNLPIYNVLKRYDKFGNEISSIHMDVKGRIGPDASYASKLRCSNDRVGWLTGASEYLEFGLDGHEIARFDGPPWKKDYQPSDVVFTELALSANNEVVATLRGKGQSLWSLDRTKRVWIPIDVSAENFDTWAQTFGFDGEELIFGSRTRERGTLLIRYGFAPRR